MQFFLVKEKNRTFHNFTDYNLLLLLFPFILLSTLVENYKLSFIFCRITCVMIVSVTTADIFQHKTKKQSHVLKIRMNK